jgi:dTDP-4-amino-4,6-dideoxygalactose transaminase
VFHLYVVRTPQREAVQARLRGLGVATGIHYPSPVHQQPAYRDRVALGPSGCQQTEAVARDVLSLPLYPELTDAQVEQVCAALRTQ